MNNVPTFSYGVMTVALEGETFDLAANVRASRTICRLYGGLTDAFRKANEYDFDTLVTVINTASGRVGKAAEATAETVFAAGIVTVAPLVTTYLNFLAAGGKVAKATTDETAATEAAPLGEAI